ncbi:hypothetical protein AERO8C_20428 [Aeromonas veronii]|uniref:Uncharacterized protein n=1 Tax=Aeromonas veronii TaxID=654 RepID=A0A653L2Z5_AERVE|nr:hypothetical protein AERO8C_20428 [Aeromonas veronii]
MTPEPTDLAGSLLHFSLGIQGITVMIT